MELETQQDVLYWFIIVIVPLFISMFTLYHKQSTDKREQENRLTNIESNQKNNTKAIERIEKEQFIVREDLKQLKSINEKQDILFDMLKELREELREELKEWKK